MENVDEYFDEPSGERLSESCCETADMIAILDALLKQGVNQVQPQNTCVSSFISHLCGKPGLETNV